MEGEDGGDYTPLGSIGGGMMKRRRHHHHHQQPDEKTFAEEGTEHTVTENESNQPNIAPPIEMDIKPILHNQHYGLGLKEKLKQVAAKFGFTFTNESDTIAKLMESTAGKETLATLVNPLDSPGIYQLTSNKVQVWLDGLRGYGTQPVDAAVIEAFKASTQGLRETARYLGTELSLFNAEIIKVQPGVWVCKPPNSGGIPAPIVQQDLPNLIISVDDPPRFVPLTDLTTYRGYSVNLDLLKPWQADNTTAGTSNADLPSFIHEVCDQLQKFCVLEMQNPNDHRFKEAIIGLESSRIGKELWVPYLKIIMENHLVQYSPLWRSEEHIRSINYETDADVVTASNTFKRNIQTLSNTVTTWTTIMDTTAVDENAPFRKVQQEMLNIIRAFGAKLALVDKAAAAPLLKTLQDQFQLGLSQIFMQAIGNEILATSKILTSYLNTETAVKDLTIAKSQLTKENDRLKQQIKNMQDEGRVLGGGGVSSSGGGGGGGKKDYIQMIDSITRLVVTAHLRQNNTFYRFAELVAGASNQISVSQFLKVDIEELLVTRVRSSFLQKNQQPIYTNLEQRLSMEIPQIPFAEDTFLRATLIAARDLTILNVEQSMFEPKCAPKALKADLLRDPLLGPFATLVARHLAKTDEVHKRVATSQVAKEIMDNALLEADMNLRTSLAQKYKCVILNPWKR
jgi:hypothetical protein